MIDDELLSFQKQNWLVKNIILINVAISSALIQDYRSIGTK